MSARTDFISQGSVDAGLELPDDMLGHDAMARAIVQKATYLPPGTVIAVQGPWGRGKTDVLGRITKLVTTSAGTGLEAACETLWINPWQYGTPDLLTPIVIGLLEKIPPVKRSNNKSLRKAAESILRAGLNFGLKVTSVALPGASLVGLAADGVDRLFAGLFEALEKEDGTSDGPDADPVAVMGKRFTELVEALVSPARMKAGARVLVCVDDIDRCLPDRQIALLEAIRFLISSGAPATFLIAIDPTLAKQAVLTHYRTESFDPDRYLDKMFDLRVNLPSVGDNVRRLIESHLARSVVVQEQTMLLKGALLGLFGKESTVINALPDAAATVLTAGDLASPRLIRRIMDRLYLLACEPSAHGTMPLQGEEAYRVLVAWLAIAERWPDVRAAVQHAGVNGFVDTMKGILMHYGLPIRGTAQGGVPTQRLPAPRVDLSAMLRATGGKTREEYTFIAGHVQQIEAALLRAGL